MDTTDSLSIVAIIVASVAFLIAAMQFLQQIFATADGYRRCQSSVMGGWSQYTHRKFRWAEMRFETVFATPHIMLRAPNNEAAWDSLNMIPLFPASLENLGENGMPGHGSDLCEISEYACWVKLIQEIETMQSEMLRLFPAHNSFLRRIPPPGRRPDPRKIFNSELNSTRVSTECCHDTMQLPCLDFNGPSSVRNCSATDKRQRQCTYCDHSRKITPSGVLDVAFYTIRTQSWDFVPPEIVKPLAMMCDSDLVVLAIRLGMKWIVFHPAQGIFRAQGSGMMLESARLRSVGTTVAIHWYSDRRYQSREMLVPTKEAASMLFGAVRSDILVYYFALGNYDGVKKLMGERNICLSAESKSRLDELNTAGLPLHGFIDIIPICANFMRQRGSPITRVPALIKNATGILHSSICRHVFLIELQKLMNASSDLDETDLSILRTILDKSKRLPDVRYPCWWHPASSVEEVEEDSDLWLVEIMHDHWVSVSSFLLHEHHKQLVRLVIFSHLKVSIEAHADAEATTKNGKPYRYAHASEIPEDFPERVWNPVFAETTHLWFQHLKDIFEDVRTEIESRPTGRYAKGKYYGPPVTLGRVTAIWAAIIFNGLCWASCHEMVDVGHVSGEHCWSRMPVYIM
jgi:hypothetical protein